MSPHIHPGCTCGKTTCAACRPLTDEEKKHHEKVKKSTKEAVKEWEDRQPK